MTNKFLTKSIIQRVDPDYRETSKLVLADSRMIMIHPIKYIESLRRMLTLKFVFLKCPV